MDAFDKLYQKNQQILKRWPFPVKGGRKTISHKDVVGSLKLVLLCTAIPLVFYYAQSHWVIAGLISIVMAKLVFNPMLLLNFYNLILSLGVSTPCIFSKELKEKTYPKLVLLEDRENWMKIRAELDVLMQSVSEIPFLQKIDPSNRFIAKNDDGKKGWRVFILKYGHQYIEKNCEKCPHLYRLLKDIPHVRSCFFSILDGNKHIPLHTGYFKGVLRYHLGMYVPEPENVHLVVHEEKQHWKEGEGFIFDDMFPHEVRNYASTSRIVLYVDLDRDLPYPLNIVNRTLVNLSLRLSKQIKDAVDRLENGS